jgi:hypothetical protein
MIKRMAMYSALLMSIAVRCALAQASASAPAYHAEVGIFAEDFRLGRISPTLDMPGAGVRIALFPQSWFQLEGEASYDFTQTFTSSWTNGFVTDSLTTHLRVARGLGGAKLDKRFRKKMRLFATVKVGFIDFTASTANIPQGFTNPQDPATTGGTDLLLYPGGGVEYSFGRWGLRFDAGDDLYFDHGHHYTNIKASFGPTFRF